MPSDFPSLDSILNTTITIARGAGAILLEGLAEIRAGKLGSVRFKSTPVDVVTEYDRRSEDYIVAELRRHFPDDPIVGEEGGAYAIQNPQSTIANREWQVDPLDGTTNFSHGFSIFSVSIGLLIDGVPTVGVVYSPATDELYAAARGLGATWNGKPIRVSRIDALQRALLITGFPYDYDRSPDNNLAAFDAFNRQSQAVRRIGSAALDLCLVASGQMDGYWETKIKPHDITAGIAIVREAGGTVTDSAGGDDMLNTGRIVASNGLLHPIMLGVLAGQRVEG